MQPHDSIVDRTRLHKMSGCLMNLFNGRISNCYKEPEQPFQMDAIPMYKDLMILFGNEMKRAKCNKKLITQNYPATIINSTKCLVPEQRAILMKLIH